MSNTVIKIENISKLYNLGEVGTGTISHDLNRWWHTSILGKEDPYTKIGHVNDRTKKAEKGEHVWALRDINLEVDQGEVLGIIGRNGAGKSTLLKLLSRVTSPTTGTIKTKGRLASLLEVGTGFHPEMTGKENIYMNGTIMGMRKWEITNKLEEIVEFAGVAKYLDTPTKRYSSGMTVRLGFAIAAFLEPEILVVDEVLAVGDAEFQKKAIGKMKDVSKGGGRTVLFVSHNMGSINALCSRAVLLDNGTVANIGPTQEITALYYNQSDKNSSEFSIGKTSSDEQIVINHVRLFNKHGESTNNFLYGEDIIIEMDFGVENDIQRPYIWLGIRSILGPVTSASGLIDGYRTEMLKKGNNIIRCRFIKPPLFPGNYTISMGTRDNNGNNALTIPKEVANFNIVSSMAKLGFNGTIADTLAPNSAPMIISYEWEFNDGKRYTFDPANYIN